MPITISCDERGYQGSECVTFFDFMAFWRPVRLLFSVSVLEDAQKVTHSQDNRALSSTSRTASPSL